MRMSPESGMVIPIIMRMVLVLPAPFGPSRAENLALLDGEREIVDGDEVVVGFPDLVQFDRVHWGSTLFSLYAVRRAKVTGFQIEAMHFPGIRRSSGGLSGGARRRYRSAGRRSCLRLVPNR